MKHTDPNKSFVSLEAAICPVCGKQHQTGTLLLDKHMRPSMEKETLTGWGLCEEHKKLADEGFIALVGIDPTKSTFGPNGDLSMEGAYRTGRMVHIKQHLWSRMFNLPEPSRPMAFVEDEVIGMLEQMQAENHEEGGE